MGGRQPQLGKGRKLHQEDEGEIVFSIETHTELLLCTKRQEDLCTEHLLYTRRQQDKEPSLHKLRTQQGSRSY